jgi:transcriptional regulator with XRE-family HTH domain
MHPYFKRLGKRLKDARRAKGWTQQELAERTGLTAAFLSYLENGSRSGSLESLVKLAEALSLEPESLMGGKGLKEPKAGKFPSLSLEGLTVGDSEVVRKVARSLRKKKA